MNRKGVTLVELIVVMVIIAILAALMVPNMGAWLPKYRLRSATRDIVSTMRDGQMKAVSTRNTYQVNFNAGNSYILQRNSSGVWFNEGVAQALPPGIAMDVTALPAGVVVFDPNSTCTPGSVKLNQIKGGVIQDQKRIVINAATGKLKIE